MGEDVTVDRLPPRTGRGVWRRVLPLAIIVAGLALAYLTGVDRYLTLAHFADSRHTLRSLVIAHPVLAPLAFVLLYTFVVAFSFPFAWVLTLVAGFLFGWLLGSSLSLVAATTGATILFLVARSAFGDLVVRRADGRIARLADGFRRDAFAYLLILRLAPIVPFVVVNVAPALFGVRAATFAAATALGRIPATLTYAWLGQGLDGVFDRAAKAGRAPAVSDLITVDITLAFAALALVAGSAIVVRRVMLSRPSSRRGPVA